MNTVMTYPYITPPSNDWLKLAALCWDKVYRLVPSHGWSHDPYSVQRLDDALGGILGTVNVEQYTNSIWESFWSYVDANEDELRRGRWIPDIPLGSDSGIWPHHDVRFWQYESDLIAYATESSDRFLEGLQERGLARIEDNYYSDRTIHMPIDVGSHFLSLCALEAAKAQTRDLAANELKFTNAVLHPYSVRGEVATAILQPCGKRRGNPGAFLRGRA